MTTAINQRIYDGLSRLIEADYNYGTTVYTYAYDLAGNLVDLDGVTRTFNAANQMTHDGTNTLSYDNNGNLVDDGVKVYTWDRANRLLEVDTGTPAELSAYAYNGVGNRISQAIGTSSPVVTQYLLDTQPGLAVVLQQTVDSNVDRFIHGPRGIHAQQDNSGDWFWPLQDGLGSVRGVADDVLAVQGMQHYEPIGVPFGAQGSLGMPFGFTGEQTDANDLVYLRARYLNPGLGTFLSLDPFEGMAGRPMSLNGYMYVEGDPVNKADPTGMFSDCFPQLEPLARQKPTRRLRRRASNARQPRSTTPIQDTVTELRALNATIVIRTVNYVSQNAVKTCDPQEFSDHPERFGISGAGLGTLTERGLWTHDHFEEHGTFARGEGDPNRALTNIATHDCVQFIGGGQGSERMIMTHARKVTALNKTHENVLLLLSNILNFDNDLISLSRIASPVTEAAFRFECQDCNVGMMYAHFTVSLSMNTSGDNIHRALWRYVGIDFAGTDTDDGLIAQPIPLEDSPGTTIFGYRFYPHGTFRPGDSGGGVFDMQGRLIGVNQAGINERDPLKGGIFTPIVL